MNNPRPLPITRDISTLKILTAIVIILMGVLSLAGLIFPSNIYPSEALIQTFMMNDVINLIVGIPILVGSIWLTGREKLVGLLLWPGALLFVIYNYIAYMIGIPFSALTLAYLALILLSAYIILDLLKAIDDQTVQEKLSGNVSEKIAGWFLVIFGILFIFRAISIIIPSINQATLPPTELGVSIADIIISTLWLIGGILLLRQKPLGYTSGLGLLFAASMLFIGLVIFLIIQPIFTTAQFQITDVIVVAVMGLILSIPFALFLRGTIKSS